MNFAVIIRTSKLTLKIKNLNLFMFHVEYVWYGQVHFERGFMTRVISQQEAQGPGAQMTDMTADRETLGKPHVYQTSAWLISPLV
jgi:hypothetical protein